MKLIEKVEEVLAAEKTAIHVDEIAIKLVEKFPNTQEDLNVLPGKISSILSSAVKRQDSKFSKPKNKKGRFRKGMYRLKRTKIINSLPKVEQPNVSSQYTGCAGEHAVLSELLFWGFNASIMTVDDGIDIVASKENNYFHIQVKTANPRTGNGGYSFGVNRERFKSKHSSSTFYIFVIRRHSKERNFNDFIIMPSSNIQRLVDNEIIKGKDTLSISVSELNNGKIQLNKTEDVTAFVNCWDTIV